MKTFISQKYAKYKKFKPRLVRDIREGDVFYNSQGNLTLIQCVHGSGSRVKLESETGTIWHDDRLNVLHRVIQGVYTDYAIEDITIKTETKNETKSPITTDGESKRNKAIKKQISSRRIAIASPLIGNTISISDRRRQVRTIKISEVSICTRYY